MLKQLALSLLRLLIGIGFTLSLAIGVTLTQLTLCDGSGNTLTLNRTGLHWEWGGAAAISFAVTAACWLCWRRLPPVKPTRMFPTLERWMQGTGFFACGAGIGAFLAFDMGARLLSHAAGARWAQFWYYAFIAVSNGLWAISAWRKRTAKK